jgi:phosphohistidine swiveling domain-containing protein
MVMITAEEQTSAFPREWDVAAGDGPAFQFDPMHFPFPVTPLTDSALNSAFAAGFTAAAREMNTPIEEVQARGANWFHFERYITKQPSSEDEARAMGERAEATAKREIGRLGERWEQEHLPALKAHLQRLGELEAAVGSVTGAAAAALIEEAQAIHRDLWTIHFRIAIPMLLAMQLYDEFYADVFGGTESDAHALLRGVWSESVKAGLGLYELAIAAKELGLESIFRETPSDRLVATLESSDAGQEMLARLWEYLEAYGLRQDLFDLGTPTWREHPEIALSSVRTYILTGRDERAEYEAIARSADNAISAARAQLASYPEAVRSQFEGMLQAGRTASFLQEEHNFYIDQQGLSRLRLFFLGVGRALATSGILERDDDVFMFTLDELRDLVTNTGEANRAGDARALVRARREELQIARTLSPPPFIGEPSDEPPPDNPMARAIGRFFGGPPQQAQTTNELKGNAGSRGVVTGPAKVARTLEEATRVQPGDILVAVTTMPAWTPLFGIAAAVVTETGGPLSHCAIVAREYGIPAVVGAHGATRAIADGQRVTVDGGRGVVTLDG